MKEKVMVGMSGGVDSSVTALLLKNEGFDVVGATLKLFCKSDKKESSDERTCGSLSDIDDAKLVSKKLGLEHFVFDFGNEFNDKVIKNFIESYNLAKTPNPCIECNKHIKFSKMLESALDMGCDYIATGHYVQREYDEESGRYLLKKAADDSKDQTYVLYNLTQHQLKHTLFPLGGYLKSDIRRIAEENELVNARKPDSQDICFVPDGDYAKFIEETQKIKPRSGSFVDKDGNVLGTHSGIINYTIGQRKGLGVTFGEPRFVIKKDAEKNTVMIGRHEELFSTSLVAENVNWIKIDSLKEPMRVSVKARYKQKETPATIYPLENGAVRAEFDEPQRAISPGQSAVFYDGDYVVGGGIIK